MHNSSAMMALGELKKNDKSLSKQQKKVGTGMKIVGAGDGASEYAISERMRTNIRALNQANDNVTTGKNMINLASAAIDQQVSIMRQVAARTMQASDDTYNDNDRATLNKEISQLLDQSDDIARQTTYNGIHLLDQTRVSSATPWFDADAPYHENNPPIQALTVLTSTGTYKPTQQRYEHITLNPPNIYDPSKLGAGSSFNTLPSSGSKVWNTSTNALDTVTTNASGALVFQSNSQNVTLSNIAIPMYTTPYTTIPANGTSVVYFSQGSPASYYLGRTTTVTAEPGSGIASVVLPDSSTSITEIDFSSLFSTATNIPADLNGVGFSMDCKGYGCDQYVSIQFDSSKTDSTLYVGEKSALNPKPMCYVIGVANVTSAADLATTVFNGIVAAGAANPAFSGSTGTATLPSSTDISTSIAERHSIQMNYFAATGKFTISKDGPAMEFFNGVIGDMKTDFTYKPEQLKHIQSSGKGSQNTAINLPNTTLSILFPRSSSHWDIDPTSEDYPTTYSADYSNCKNETERRLQWKDTEWPYPSKYVAFDKDHMVDTREKASAFLDNVHQAIKYLLYSNTTLGAQSNRLNYTSANLVNTVENTQASESTIRDADMAKEMTSYVKSNVLAQSAQAMLAQANQNGSSVLSLLQ